MMRLLSLALLLLLPLRLLAVSPQDWPYTAVCEIQAGNQGGSGTLLGIVGDTGVVGTAQHVVERISSVSVFFANGYKTKGRVLGTNAELDLAAIAIYIQPGMQTTRGLRLAKEGEEVIACGYPYYSKNIPHWTKGTVLKATDSRVYFKSSPYVHSGVSGGLLIGKDGYYLGSTNGYGQGYCYAAGGPAMIQFFSKWVQVAK